MAFELIREVGVSSDQPHLVSRLGGFAYRPASAAIAGKLGLEKGEPVWRLERKQMAEAQAASASQHHIHLPEGATIPAGEIAKPLSTEDLYALLRIRVARMDLRLAAIQATPEQAKLLGIEEGDPLLSSEDLVYGQGAGHPPEAVVKELSVGERASLAVRVASKT